MLRFCGKNERSSVQNQISSRYYPADTKARYVEIEFEGFVLGRRILLLYPDVSRRVLLTGYNRRRVILHDRTTSHWRIDESLNSRGRNLFGDASEIGP